MKRIPFHIVSPVSLSLLAFTMILFPKLLPIPIALYALVLVFGAVKKYVHFEFNKVLLLFLLLYISYTIGSLFTEHKDVALKYLEYKLSFVLFPILFSFKSKEKISLEFIGIGLVLGTVFLFFIEIVNSFDCYMSSSEMNCFFSSSFSRIHHPSYSSVFYLFALDRKSVV